MSRGELTVEEWREKFLLQFREEFVVHSYYGGQIRRYEFRGKISGEIEREGDDHLALQALFNLFAANLH